MLGIKGARFGVFHRVKPPVSKSITVFAKAKPSPELHVRARPAAAHVRHSEFQLQLAAAQAEFAAAQRGALSPRACRRRSENSLT